MHTTTLKPAGRSTAQMARDVISLFKLRIGVLIMITALVGMAVTSGPAPSFVQALVLAISVLMASASAGAFNQYVEFESAAAGPLAGLLSAILGLVMSRQAQKSQPNRYGSLIQSQYRSLQFFITSVPPRGQAAMNTILL